mgnify:CR=1 FL=1
MLVIYANDYIVLFQLLHFHRISNYNLISGYTDYAYRNTEFTFAPDSYSDFLAQDLGAELVPLACPGFRTIEMRYMLEDDYRDACEDPYLFTPSQLYWFESHPYPGDNGNHAPGSEYFRAEMKKAISEADLITIGIGGNDWGEYLKWVLGDILAEEHVADEYIQDAKEIGYRYILLDTFPFLERAIHMYRVRGFREIEKYNDSPMASTIYMKLDL